MQMTKGPLQANAQSLTLASAGEGIYFAAKSGRMCAEAIVAGSAQGTKMAGEKDIRVYLDKCALPSVQHPISSSRYFRL